MDKEKLKQAGLKITRSREAVLGFLQKKQQPLSAPDIYKALKKELDQVTVYRILEALEKVGIVWRDLVGNQATYYLSDKQHHHIVCRKCGAMKCLPCEHSLFKIKGFKKVKHQLTLTGVCQQCFKV